MTALCPMTDRPCEFDAGFCVDCERPEPPTVERVPDDEFPDAWVSLALEDAYSLGGDA